MPSITIELTPEQEKFLKLFAKNHYPGAVDNLATDIPIHIVQSKTHIYIPVDEDYAEEAPEDVVFSTTMFSNDQKFKTPGELVTAYYKDEACPAHIFEYKDIKNKEIVGVDGERHYIYSFSAYFGAYGIETYGVEYVLVDWENIAFFFIHKEARLYVGQQSHNLRKPRIYSYSPGYSNNGEYRHFYELLRSMGNKLLAEE